MFVNSYTLLQTFMYTCLHIYIRYNLLQKVYVFVCKYYESLNQATVTLTVITCNNISIEIVVYLSQVPSASRISSKEQ